MLKRKSSVAVLGAGHGGLALAGFLSRQGHRVALWNRSLERIAPVRQLGGIRLSMPGSLPDGRGPEREIYPVARATCSMAHALADAEVVFVAVPASGHVEVASHCAPFLRDGQTVLLLPGRTCGALEFRQVLRENGCRAQILLGETNTFPFAARCAGPASAVIFGTKTAVLAAALPSMRTFELLAECRPLLPMLASAESVLETGLGNLGAILHPTITLLNAERIERGDSFDFYAEGVTNRVAQTLAAADEERLAIAEAYQVPACSLQDWVADAYGHRAATVRDAVGGNPAYVGIKAPNTLDHRYLLEDVPTGLIPLIELGDAAGVAVPTLSKLVDMCRIILGGEPWPRQRTLDVLGLDGLDIEKIRNLVDGEVVARVWPNFLGDRIISTTHGGKPGVDDLSGMPQRKRDISVDESLKLSEHSV